MMALSFLREKRQTVRAGSFLALSLSGWVHDALGSEMGYLLDSNSITQSSNLCDSARQYNMQCVSRSSHRQPGTTNVNSCTEVSRR